MNSSAYWDDRYKELMNNQPQKAESFYNKSFVERMNDAQRNIDSLVAEKDKAWSAAAQKQDDYETFYGTMSNYNEVYNKAESEFGVTEHQNNYEKNKKALALAESTMSALPSAINASSNRVLTQAQRELKYNVLADRQAAYRTNLQTRVAAYEDVWKKARENQATYAKAEIESQWRKLGDYNNAWNIAMQDYLNAEKKLTAAKQDLLSTKEEYRTWQSQQYENANNVWMSQLNTALDRYTAALDAELSMKKSDVNAYLESSNAEKERLNSQKTGYEKWYEMTMNLYNTANALLAGRYSGGGLGGSGR